MTQEDSSLLNPAEQAKLAAPAGDFVEDWCEYGTMRTDAPRRFHEAAAIVLVASAIDRNRWLNLRHKRVFPSAYIVTIAGSGRRKSTPLTYATDAASAAFKDRVLASDYSPEALMEHLSTRTPSRGVAFIDEAGGMLKNAKKQGYAEGIKDLLSRLWDAPEDYELRRIRARSRISSVYVNLVMATTFSRFGELVTPEDVASGFLARFLPFVVTETVERRPVAVAEPVIETSATTLATWLKDRYDHLQKQPGAMPITLDALDRINTGEEALSRWADRAFHADMIQPWAQRLTEYVQRLSVIFAISESALQVERRHVLRALKVVDQAKEGVHVLVEGLTKTRAVKERDKLERFIRMNPRISRREACRRTNLSAGVIEGYAQELEGLGRIMVENPGVQEQYWPTNDVLHAALAA